MLVELLIIALLIVMAAMAFAPIFPKRGRFSRPDDGYKITPEIEKARQLNADRLSSLQEQRERGS